MTILIVIVLPEMWNTGYALNELDGLADKADWTLKNSCLHFVRKHAVLLLEVQAVIEKGGTLQYNLCLQ